MIVFGLFPLATHTPLCNLNETVILSFITKNNKITSICVSTDQSYIVYRYGQKNKIELEFPADKKDSWLKFKYSYYFRGGGADNEGLDLNYLTFTNNDFKYTIYEEYSATDNSTIYGIRIKNINNKKTFEIVGNPENVIGSLVRLKNYDKIQIDEEQ